VSWGVGYPTRTRRGGEVLLRNDSAQKPIVWRRSPSCIPGVPTDDAAIRAETTCRLPARPACWLYRTTTTMSKKAQPNPAPKKSEKRERKVYTTREDKTVFERNLIPRDHSANEVLMGASSVAPLRPMVPVSDALRRLHDELRGTMDLWHLSLLETLYSPMARYPLPCMSHHMYTSPTGTIPADYNVANPAITSVMTPGDIFPGGPLSAVGIAQATMTYNPGSGTYVPINPVNSDAAVFSKYDERDGLCRGTFSVTGSGAFVLFFDPFEVNATVRAVAITDTEASWMDTGNWSSTVFSTGLPVTSFTWDRDPYRGYAGDFQPVGYYDLQTDLSSLAYCGGAVLHMAVQAKTAYSDVSIKARSALNYDRRFYNTPTLSGEYGDPTQPTRATEGLAVFNGSTWNQRVFLPETAGEKSIALRLEYAIQAGFPLLEVHVVNASTGGAPVNFNFEARSWLGFTFHTLKDAATTSLSTIACEIPPWFTSCAIRGAISSKSTELANEIILNTHRVLRQAPLPRPVAKVNNLVDTGKRHGFLRDVMDAVGLDPQNPLGSLAKKLIPVAGEAILSLL